MMSIRGIIGCSAAVLLVALSSAVEVYDDLAPANLERDLAYQEGHDLDKRHVDEMNVRSLQAHHRQARVPYGSYGQKTDELPARNLKVFKRQSNVMSDDALRSTKSKATGGIASKSNAGDMDDRSGHYVLYPLPQQRHKI